MFSQIVRRTIVPSRGGPLQASLEASLRSRVSARTLGRTHPPPWTLATSLPERTRHYSSYRRFNNSHSHAKVRYLVYNGYFLYFVAGCAVFYVYNLDSAPYTGRKRFLWIPYWLEKKIGDYAYQQLLEKYKNHHTFGPPLQQAQRVMNRLLTTAIDSTKDLKQKAHLQSLDWKIHIIYALDPTQEPPNAFILPNGKIFIFSDILPICKNDDGLATVLSHELSHQLAHHSLEQLSKQPIYIVLSLLLYALTGISGWNDLLIAGLFQMPLSRAMESEADRIGCELMARLCFNFREAVKFWGRMEDMEKKLQNRVVSSSEFVMKWFSTHPDTKKRIHDIQLWIPELTTIQEASDCDQQWELFLDFSRHFFGS